MDLKHRTPDSWVPSCYQQTDGYVAYEKVGGPKLVHAGCWAHSRRKFFDAVKLNPNDAVATRIVKRIDELFGIDAVAREEKLDHAARHVQRLESAQPLVEIIREEAEAARDAALPSSALGKAAYYTPCNSSTPLVNVTRDRPQARLTREMPP